MTRTIECSNCGDTGPAFWITLAGLLIAAVALTFNAVQFRAFLQQAKARARFRVTLRVQRAGPDGVMRTDGNKAAVRIEIGLKNDGDRAAGETLINAIVPERQELVRWAGPNGEEKPGGDITTPAPDEVLVDGDGREFAGQYLATTLPRVGTKPYHLVHFQFYVTVPDTGEVTVPIRVRIQADEIPDDVEEYVEDLLVRVSH